MEVSSWTLWQFYSRVYYDVFECRGKEAGKTPRNLASTFDLIGGPAIIYNHMDAHKPTDRLPRPRIKNCRCEECPNSIPWSRTKSAIPLHYCHVVYSIFNSRLTLLLQLDQRIYNHLLLDGIAEKAIYGCVTTHVYKASACPPRY